MAAFGGLGLLLLVGTVLLRRRRDGDAVDQTALKAAMEPEPLLNTEGREPPTPTQPTAPKVLVSSGPPGGKVAAQPSVKPAKGPPRKPPTSTMDPLDTKAMAAKHFGALDGPSNVSELNQQRVEDYTKLPGGGDYEYTAEGTFYVVDGDVGKWRLNDDKSFTKLNE